MWARPTTYELCITFGKSEIIGGGGRIPLPGFPSLSMTYNDVAGGIDIAGQNLTLPPQ